MKYYIGIDLGGTNVRTILVDEKGGTYSEAKESTEKQFGPDYVCDKIIRMIESLDYSPCNGIENVQGIGIGVPGPVDTVNNVMIMATNLGKGFEGYPLCAKLQEKFNLPTFIDNDANVAGLAEAILGAGKNYRTCYYVTISTGIGGAFVVDGKLISGGRGHAGEIGNIIVKNNGYKHNTLNPGAAEGEASGTALTRKGKELIGEQVAHAGHVFELASAGNEIAQGLVDEFIDNISTLFANISHTVDPHCIIIGGGVMKAKEHFFDRLVEAFNSKIHSGMQGHIQLVQNELEDCGAIGAAMLPMSRL